MAMCKVTLRLAPHDSLQLNPTSRPNSVYRPSMQIHASIKYNLHKTTNTLVILLGYWNQLSNVLKKL